MNTLIYLDDDINFGNNVLEISKSRITIDGTVENYRLYSSNPDTCLIEVTGDRITFKRIEFDGNSVNDKSGIVGVGANYITVDDCELHDWGFAAVRLTASSTEAIVKDSYFHDNDQDGLGYGVAVYSGSFAVIDNNDFDYNRHDIEGDGHPDSGYEALNNTTNHTNTNSHAFDMHGYAQFCVDEEDEHIAGGYIYIHDNTFSDATETAIEIRGVPQDGCFIEDNIFAHNSAWDAINQSIECNNNRVGGCYDPSCSGGNCCNEVEIGVNAFGGIYVYENTYNGSNPSGSEWFQVNYGGNWYNMAKFTHGLDILAFGDFNGDELSDLFYKSGTDFKISFSGINDWYKSKYSNMTFEQLGFGDFNNDGATDVLTEWGGKWRLAPNGTGGGWDSLNVATIAWADVVIADIDEDGTDDICKNIFTNFWQYYEGGLGDSKYMSTTLDTSITNNPKNKRRNPDFDGDGNADSYRTHQY